MPETAWPLTVTVQLPPGFEQNDGSGLLVAPALAVAVESEVVVEANVSCPSGSAHMLLLVQTSAGAHGIVTFPSISKKGLEEPKELGVHAWPLVK